MKKVLILLSVLMLLSLTLFAAAETVALDEGAAVTVPSGFTAFYQGMPESAMSSYGFTESSLKQKLAADGKVIEAYNIITDRQIDISAVDNPLDNLAALGDAFVSMALDMLKDEYARLGARIDSFQITHVGDVLYLVMTGADKSDISFLQYYTVVNGKAWNFTLSCQNGGKLTEKDRTLMKDMIDHVRFNGVSTAAAVPAGKGTLYTDKLSGSTFMIPAGWSEEPLSKERKSIKAKFSCDDSGMCILFGSDDLWAAMGETLQQQLKAYGFNRSNLDNSCLSDSDYASMMGVRESELRHVRYGGQEYVKMVADTDVFGLSMKQTGLICINNGYAYTFLVTGDETNQKYFSAFEELLNSVAFR